jgi:hypothetical protein
VEHWRKVVRRVAPVAPVQHSAAGQGLPEARAVEAWASGESERSVVAG